MASHENGVDWRLLRYDRYQSARLHWPSHWLWLMSRRGCNPWRLQWSRTGILWRNESSIQKVLPQHLEPTNPNIAALQEAKLRQRSPSPSWRPIRWAISKTLRQPRPHLRFPLFHQARKALFHRQGRSTSPKAPQKHEKATSWVGLTWRRWTSQSRLISNYLFPNHLRPRCRNPIFQSLHGGTPKNRRNPHRGEILWICLQRNRFQKEPISFQKLGGFRHH